MYDRTGGFGGSETTMMMGVPVLNKVIAANWIAAARQFAPQVFVPQPSPAFARPVMPKSRSLPKGMA
ncbi:hypothetical protein ABI_02180 [Asticcacaulis biprosthecium C19]|uniref:Uncharacterized protein n=1 Tax=Asticcacaulis biprosthecium C19 TaxID=715226 RepID=F4QIM8_9CAUL|nr:hypothetical protein ABI_02180 [Asticcacaulis biprosthecium C19]